MQIYGKLALMLPILPTANKLMLLARHYEQQVKDRQVVDRNKLLVRLSATLAEFGVEL